MGGGKFQKLIEIKIDARLQFPCCIPVSPLVSGGNGRWAWRRGDCGRLTREM
jgi:hypothetical protein